MDITHLFKAGVHAAKLQLKLQQRKLESDGMSSSPKDELEALLPNKNRILPGKKSASANSSTKSKCSDEFSKQAKEVCHEITNLRNVLLENRTAYMRIGQHLKSATHMTDEQRDLIDRESEKFVTYYSQHLAQLRADWKKDKRKTAQQRQHIDCVLDLLSQYLKSIQQIYMEQKKYRVQHELETYRLLKLAADKKKIPIRPAGEAVNKRLSRNLSHSSENADSDDNFDLGWGKQWSDEEFEEQQNTAKSNDTAAASKNTRPKSTRRERRKSLNDNIDSNSIDEPSATGSLNASMIEARNATVKTPQKVALDEDIQKSQQLADDEAEAAATSGLSPEDIQMFEQENKQLYQELQGLAEEVEQIERNVVDIAQLQDIFTEKVSLQQHNIERIANAVVGATENVKDANEQIKQAIQRNAGLRVWSLFFLLVMSFALLFLDWYYD